MTTIFDWIKTELGEEVLKELLRHRKHRAYLRGYLQGYRHGLYGGKLFLVRTLLILLLEDQGLSFRERSIIEKTNDINRLESALLAFFMGESKDTVMDRLVGTEVN